MNTCWRCGGGGAVYALRTPEHYAGRICPTCERSFKAWVAEGASSRTPATIKLPERRVEPPKKAAPTPFSIRAVTKADKKPKRETLEEKVERLRKKFNPGVDE